jgi:hypothetical protein
MKKGVISMSDFMELVQGTKIDGLADPVVISVNDQHAARCVACGTLFQTMSHRISEVTVFKCEACDENVA